MLLESATAQPGQPSPLERGPLGVISGGLPIEEMITRLTAIQADHPGRHRPARRAESVGVWPAMIPSHKGVTTAALKSQVTDDAVQRQLGNQPVESPDCSSSPSNLAVREGHPWSHTRISRTKFRVWTLRSLHGSRLVSAC